MESNFQSLDQLYKLLRHERVEQNLLLKCQDNQLSLAHQSKCMEVAEQLRKIQQLTLEVKQLKEFNVKLHKMRGISDFSELEAVQKQVASLKTSVQKLKSELQQFEVPQLTFKAPIYVKQQVLSTELQWWALEMLF
ncbi:Hypothetical_protein [Hexamita inflata]|uniref:Hypothetical_protein n=1 Tax=Hexamita inflata TaxID=28002 RepID=A0ABP1HBM3_9EUKA